MPDRLGTGSSRSRSSRARSDSPSTNGIVKYGNRRRLAGGEQRNDVRVLKLSGELDLAAEPVHAHARRELGQKHLHHDLPAQRDLRRHEHPRHATAPELALEVVGIAK